MFAFETTYSITFIYGAVILKSKFRSNLFQCKPTEKQKGSGILIINGIAHPWKPIPTSIRNGTRPCEENLNNDEFYADFYNFLKSPVIKLVESKDFHVFFLILFEIARRVDREHNHLTRDEVLDGVSLAMVNWGNVGVRDLLVNMFIKDLRKETYVELVKMCTVYRASDRWAYEIPRMENF